jgi:HEAT repeat protein
MQKYIEILNNKASPERWQSVTALEKMGKPAVEYLVLALKDENKWVRFAAADA